MRIVLVTVLIGLLGLAATAPVEARGGRAGFLGKGRIASGPAPTPAVSLRGTLPLAAPAIRGPAAETGTGFRGRAGPREAAPAEPSAAVVLAPRQAQPAWCGSQRVFGSGAGFCEVN